MSGPLWNSSLLSWSVQVWPYLLSHYGNVHYCHGLYRSGPICSAAVVPFTIVMLSVQVWPYLLGHYKFKSSPQERATQDEMIRTQYERIMSEWLAVEAIVRQRDKEVVAANLAKLSQVWPTHWLNWWTDCACMRVFVCVHLCVCVCVHLCVRGKGYVFLVLFCAFSTAFVVVVDFIFSSLLVLRVSNEETTLSFCKVCSLFQNKGYFV